MLRVFIRIASSRQFLWVLTIYHFQYEKENNPKLTQICSYGIFSKRLKNEFKTAMVNEASVFEPLKFYCNSQRWPVILWMTIAFNIIPAISDIQSLEYFR